MKSTPEVELLIGLRHERFVPDTQAPDLEERIMRSFRDKKYFPMFGRRSVGSLLALTAVSGIGLAASAVGVLSLVPGWNVWSDAVDEREPKALDTMDDSDRDEMEGILPNGETRTIEPNEEVFEIRALGYSHAPDEDPK